MDDIILNSKNLQLSQLDFLIRLLVAIGMGFIIGLEREFSSHAENTKTFAGMRTFSLISLIGFFSAFLSFIYGEWMIMIGFLSVLLIVVISYKISASKGHIGSTTEFASIFTFLLGAAVLMGYISISLALMVIALVLLSLKIKLKGFIGQLNQTEIYAFVRFVVLSLLILPFLPDDTITSFEVINPREVGWVVVLTSGIGFVGYLLMKFLDSKNGILITGILGGIVSSTLVTWIFSKKSKEIPYLSGECASAIFAAATVMVIRILFWVFLFNAKLLPEIVLSFAVIFISALGVTLYFFFKQPQFPIDSEKIPLGQPLNMKDAVFFGFAYTGILILLSYADKTYGSAGVYLSSMFIGLSDVDAITISMSKLAGNSIPWTTVKYTILIAAMSNTVTKLVVALWAGSQQLRRYALVGYGIILLSGGIAYLLL